MAGSFVPIRDLATGDTGLDKFAAGGAGRPIARRLRRAGYDLATAPEGFVVEDMEGPLRVGECGRARAWAATVVRQSTAMQH